jgi:hypothetical protein
MEWSVNDSELFTVKKSGLASFFSKKSDRCKDFIKSFKKEIKKLSL